MRKRCNKLTLLIVALNYIAFVIFLVKIQFLPFERTTVKLEPESPQFTTDVKKGLWIKHGDYVLIRQTAFFDNTSNPDPAVVVNIMKNDKYRMHPHLHVLIVYASLKSLCVPIKVWKRSGIYGRSMVDHNNYVMRTTQKIHNHFPDHVMFTGDSECETGLSPKIPVYKRFKKMKFGVCLHQPLYNKPQIQDIIDWIAIHQVLGAEIIYIYLETKYIPERKLRNSIKKFVKSGLVEVIDWSISIETLDYGQLGVIQDCLYRAKLTVDYLAMCDVDEIIVPRNQFSWLEMLAEIESHGINISKYASLSFENHVWIDNGRPLPVDVELCSNMSKPVYIKRTQRTLSTYIYTPPKVIVRPKVVDSCWIHYVLKKRKGLRLEYSVPMDIASVHHYRETPLSFKESVFDDTMQKYTRTSLQVINNVICGK